MTVARVYMVTSMQCLSYDNGSVGWTGIRHHKVNSDQMVSIPCCSSFICYTPAVRYATGVSLKKVNCDKMQLVTTIQVNGTPQAI